MPPLKGAGQKYISLGKSRLAEGFVFKERASFLLSSLWRGLNFPFLFPQKKREGKEKKRKLPADVRKRKNSLRESGEKNSPGAPVIGRSHAQLIRAKRPSRTAQTSIPLGRLSSSFFCIAFSHRPDFKDFTPAFAVNTRDRFKLLPCVFCKKI